MRDTSTETELAGGLEELNLDSKNKPLEKGNKQINKEDETLVVLLDWHNTLEKDEVVSQENIKSLEKLLEHCQVVLLSAVDTAKRRKQVLHDMLPSHIHQNLGKEVCWKKCGPGGKADLCWLWEATAIFDDNLQICQECEAWEIDAYQVSYKHPAKGSFPTFVEAVNAFLVDYSEW